MEVFFKYLYPLFGSAFPFQSGLTAGDDSERNVDRGYCHFLFSMKPSRLRASFQKPLVVQSFARLNGSDREPGLCTIDLLNILPKSAGNSSQCFDEWVSV